MSRVSNWLKTLGTLPLILVAIFVIFLPSLLVAAGIVGVIDWLFLDLIWMSWPTVWWILGVWALSMLVTLAGSAENILFGLWR